MERIYRHTQVGWVVIVAFTLGAALYAALMERRTAMLLVLALLAIVNVFFFVLTIEVTSGEVRWRFGLGWPRKRVETSRIEAAEVVRNPWYYGWGIRMTPRGVLYNVSGTRAVEVRLKTGTTFRLGSDEPERLRDAILAALPRAA